VTQLATADLRRGELIVCSFSQTGPGFWVAGGHFLRLPETAGDDQLGAALDEALSSSRTGASPPPRGSTPFDPVLRELRLRSYGEYMRGTLSAGIARDGDEVVVTPKQNGGSRTGFTELLDQAETLTSPSASALAQAVRRALARAT
jgi:hypothetical protein